MKIRIQRHFLAYLNMFAIVAVLTGCSGCSNQTRTISPKKATSKPYVIKGKKYEPQEHFEYEEEGVASYYGIRDGFHGKKTSTGETFNSHTLTCAHKTLPLPSIVRVTNLENGRSLMLKVNDRGPFVDGRIVDVSTKAAQMLGFYQKGTAKVRVESLVQESLALQQQPRDHMPVMLAQADIPQQAETHPLPKAKKLDVSKYPVQRLLAQASGAAMQDVPLPQKRPGWLAVKELLTPEGKGRAFAKQDVGQVTTQLASTVSTTGIFVQAGTFSKYQNAERLSHKLKPLTDGVPVRLNTVAVNNTPMFTVRLGPVNTSEKAETLIQRMAQAGHYDAQIIYE